MADLFVRIRENNRRVMRGGTYDDRIGRFRFQISEGETIKVTLNLADWLGTGVTVSSSTITNDGVTATRSEASGIFTITASAIGSGYGDTDLAVTASDGRVRVERFRFEEPPNTRRPDYDYGNYL